MRPKGAASDLIGRLDRFLKASDVGLASSDEDHRRACELLPTDRVHRLRQGIDKRRFHPDRRDRTQLTAHFGISEDELVLPAWEQAVELKRAFSPSPA